MRHLLLCYLVLGVGLTIASTAQAVPVDDPALARLATNLRPLVDHPANEVIKVVVELGPDADLDRAQSAISAIPGVTVQVASRGIVQAWAPTRALRSLTEVPGAVIVRRPWRPRPKVVSEGVGVIFQQDWAARGLTGAGQRIAVLDVEFRGYVPLLGSELPASVETHFLGAWGNAGEHGTAVAEIVHDIAPNADLAFYQFDDEGEFLQAIDLMIANGETLVTASIGFDNVWHADGTSAFSRAVDDLVATGALYFAAAGNEADCYWVGTLTDNNNDGWMEFDGDSRPEVWGWPGLDVTLRWDEPFGSAAVDLDLYLYRPNNSECGRSEDTQSGRGDPVEWATCNNGDWGYIRAFDYSGGGANGKKAWLYAAPGIDEAWMTLNESLTLPADSDAAISVGAVVWNTRNIAHYSSRGPTNDGRIKPDLVAPTDVSTAVWGPQGFPGTSASTPHVAALAALVKEANPSLSPGEVRDWLIANTVDRGPSGKDNTFGYGLIRADEPPEGGGPGDTDRPDTDNPDTDSPATDSDDEPKRRKGGCGCDVGGSPTPASLVLFGLVTVVVRRRAQATDRHVLRSDV